MPIDRIRFVSQDEGYIECCLCKEDIGPGSLVNEFESMTGHIDPYCMKCLAIEAKKGTIWEKNWS
jgi:hypothetical protein